MNKVEYTKIIRLYESHLQVKKLTNSGTIRLYLHSVNIFFKFCEKYQNQLFLPKSWGLEHLGLRELEAFIKHQIHNLNWQRSTIVTCVSGLRSFMNFLTESQFLNNNPIQHFKLSRSLKLIGEQRYEIIDIEKLFLNSEYNSLSEMQQRLLLELIYGLGMTILNITNIKTIIPELDDGTIRIYYKNSKFNDYPFNKAAIKILKSYLKKIDSIEGDPTFWINEKGRILNSSQLQNLLNKYFESNNLPSISANELRDLSVKHFSEKGADIRSMQTLRKFKQLRRLQSLRGSDYNHLKDLLKQKHIRNKTSGIDK
tara:strand:- start:467 stop:1402 length:936 start_codon:yes stop_codon:yes gene_type:complete